MSDRSHDLEEILTVIDRMRQAFSESDFDTYASLFVQSANATWWNASPVTGNLVRQGWEETAPRLREWMESRASESRGGDAIMENLQVRIEDTMAWVTFTRRYTVTPKHRASPDPAHHLRILEKHGGAWKVAFAGFLDPSVGLPNSSLIRLDPNGAVVWMNDTARAAVAAEDDLVIRNGRLRVRNSRADRTLQASIRWAAALDKSFIPTRAAVPVVVEGSEDIPTKLWWVIGDCGAIYFSLGEPGHEAHQLDAAAAVYGLSATQKIVASEIIAGRTLTEVAAHLGVSHHTVRTHLDRVFAKTGTHSQAGLVRTVLTTAAPL